VPFTKHAGVKPIALLVTFALVACQHERASSTSDGSAPPAVAPAGLLAVGSREPEIEAVAHNGQKVKLGDYLGKPVVVYFYPKDDTPGCTVEAQGLRDQWSALQKTGAVVIGVSTDDADSHRAFAQKYELPFLLVPDPDQKILKAFGVPSTLGHAKRVTFLIDKAGKIAKVFPDVNPKGHAEEVLKAIEAL
jgi:thioredoxin-dependent peroxiredoxin